MRVERDIDHVLVASMYFDEDGDPQVDFEVEHPQRCKVYHGCSEHNGFGCRPYVPHAHVEYTCAVGYEVEGIGVPEALFNYSWAGYPNIGIKGLRDMPLNHLNDIATALADQLLASDEARIPFGFEWTGGFDYWGEYDSDLTVWALEVPR